MTGRDEFCAFPDCPEEPITDTGMCQVHEHVRVLGSYVRDIHSKSSGE